MGWLRSAGLTADLACEKHVACGKEAVLAGVLCAQLAPDSVAD